MVNFYQSLESKKRESVGRKARALRGGVLRLMKDERYGHPFYWAGFVFVGSND
jgi:CHAT domain-containing protein